MYRVEDLCDLRALLDHGLDVTVRLQKVVFAKDSGEVVGGKPAPSPKGEGTGKATAQSRRVSASKVSCVHRIMTY